MAAFTTMALVGGALLGTAASAVTQRNARKAQEKQLRDQEAAAKTEAANQAALDNVDEASPDVVLGRGTASRAASGTTAERAGSSGQSGAVSSRVGGLRKKRVSAGVGL